MNKKMNGHGKSILLLTSMVGVLLAVCTQAAAPVVELKEISVTVGLAADDVSIEKGSDGFSRITFKDAVGVSHFEPGGPALPTMPLNFAVEPGSRAVSVDVKVLEEKVLARNVVIKPLMKSLPDGKSEVVPPDPAVYGQNLLLPAQIAQLTGTYVMRGNVYSGVQYAPVRYNPVKKEVRAVTKAVVTLYYESDGSGKVAVRPPRNNESFDTMYKNMVVNPEDAERHIKSRSGTDHAQKQGGR